MHLNWTLCLTSLAVFWVGCGVPAEIPGGTAGVLQADGQPLPDVLVSVYPDAPLASEPLGIGITGPDGRFELRTRDPLAPLILEPGEYRFTVESMGEIHLIWPAEYADPSETPLTQAVSTSDEELHINVPEPRVSEISH